MENGELDEDCEQYLNSFSIDAFDWSLIDTHECTHTHTCNPPGPDLPHSHTCVHVHTKTLPAPSEDKATDDFGESLDKSSNKRPSGNREAVRKYREKKKARAASLEDEVVELRARNQHLMKKLQGQDALEAEIARLKCLLVDIRGRIEGEIGSFPYQKAKCADGIRNLPQQNYCLQSGLENRTGEIGAVTGQGLGPCDIGNIDSTCIYLPNCGCCNVVPTVESTVSREKIEHIGAGSSCGTFQSV